MKKILFLGLILFLNACEDNLTNSNVLEPDESAESFGCGNVFIYQYLEDSKVLTVRIVGNNSNLKKEEQTIDLNDTNSVVTVVLEIAGDDPDSIYFNFCNDVGFENMGSTIKYIATSGKLTYSVSENNPIKDPVWESSYFITVKIENLHLYNKSQNKNIIINKIIFPNVKVGWLPG